MLLKVPESNMFNKNIIYKKNELIAFGDGENDIEMLQEVGLSVAMGMQLIM